MISAKDMQKKKLSKDSMTLLPCFYFVELPIVASSIVTLYFLELTDLFRPAKVGFQCYDRALSMPYVEPSEELIPLLMLLSLAFAGPAASVSNLEYTQCVPYDNDTMTIKDGRMPLFNSLTHPQVSLA
ncbi:hypothetical protein chiPu_0018917 [Chiloscyllium punctatum]|uniref:Phosphatidic acid phosphatase type 2/haloperoxidase domain-containing protein n=1 Tax=Chiloscyllium punctatum TaxID=137246 RepID=A0A401RQA8_CHIPU|nr:hypothetical protein [Chiloscyllium punctatum]